MTQNLTLLSSLLPDPMRIPCSPSLVGASIAVCYLVLYHCAQTLKSGTTSLVLSSVIESYELNAYLSHCFNSKSQVWHPNENVN